MEIRDFYIYPYIRTRIKDKFFGYQRVRVTDICSYPKAIIIFFSEGRGEGYEALYSLLTGRVLTFVLLCSLHNVFLLSLSSFNMFSTEFKSEF